MKRMATHSDFEFSDNNYLDKYLDTLYDETKTSSTLNFNRKLKRPCFNKENFHNNGSLSNQLSSMEKSSPAETLDYSLACQKRIENVEPNSDFAERQHIPRNFYIDVTDQIQTNASEESQYPQNIKSFDNNFPLTVSEPNRFSVDSIENVDMYNMNFQKELFFVKDTKYSDTDVHQNSTSRNFHLVQTSSSLYRHSVEKHSLKRHSTENRFSCSNLPRNKRFRKYSHSHYMKAQESNSLYSDFVTASMQNDSNTKEFGNNSKHLLNSQNDSDVLSAFKNHSKTNSWENESIIEHKPHENIQHWSMNLDSYLRQTCYKETNFERTDCMSSKSASKYFTHGSEARLNKSAEQLQCKSSLSIDSEYLSGQAIEELFENLYRQKTETKLKFRRRLKSRSLPSFPPPTLSQECVERSKEEEKDDCDNLEKVNVPTLVSEEESDSDSNKSGIISERKRLDKEEHISPADEKIEDRTRPSHFSHPNVNQLPDKDKIFENEKLSATDKNIKYNEHDKKHERHMESKRRRSENKHSKSNNPGFGENSRKNIDYRENRRKRKIRDDKSRRSIESNRGKGNRSSRHKDRHYEEDKQRIVRHDRKNSHKHASSEKRKNRDESKLRYNLKDLSNHKDDESEKKRLKNTFFHHFRSEKHMKTRGVLKIIQHQQKLAKELTTIDQKIQERILEKHEELVGMKDNIYDCLDDLDEKVSLISDLDIALPTSDVTEWSNGERQYTLTKNNQPEQLLHNGGIWKSITKEKV